MREHTCFDLLIALLSSNIEILCIHNPIYIRTLIFYCFVCQPIWFYRCKWFLCELIVTHKYGWQIIDQDVLKPMD